MLYERLGAPCTQCGRRFQSDGEGKKKKAAHMDWHFHVNKRMADSEKRGQHRSWYVDELDWIKSRETQDDQLPTVANGAAGVAGGDSSAAAKGPKLQYLPVPDDPALANSLCPICQERFEMKWLDDAQEFVWMDAVKIGDRIYHASCHAEAKMGGSNTPAYRGTPEPVLGKRKTEVRDVVPESN
jgi:pre-mRNA cleavage complex 2 protein Pcf11